MIFNSPKIEDKVWVDEIISKASKEQTLICADIPFGTNFLWSGMYNIKICRYKDFIVKCFGNEEDVINFTYPIGVGDVFDTLKNMLNYAFTQDKKVVFSGLTKQQTEELNILFNNKITFEENRDYAEYVYNSEDLANLAGRKYHSKRNHISKFNKLYNYSFEEINDNNFNDVIEIADNWCENNKESINSGINHEYCAIKLALQNFEKLNLKGGLLRIDNKPVSMAIGEEISKEAFVVHFEKAVEGYNGLYTVINKLFSQTLVDYKYINREEDLGIEGLRKAKLSYKPTILVEEFTSEKIGKDYVIL